MKKIVLLLVIFVSSQPLLAQDSTAFLVVEPMEYREQISEKVQLVDVRTPEEFAEGHIKGAENIDFLADGFLAKFEDFKKNEPLYIYCRSGNRSSQAAKKLSEAGFLNIIDLRGGFLAWKEMEGEK